MCALGGISWNELIGLFGQVNEDGTGFPDGDGFIARAVGVDDRGLLVVGVYPEELNRQDGMSRSKLPLSVANGGDVGGKLSLGRQDVSRGNEVEHRD